MAQTTTYVDITRSFLPADPNSFPESIIDTLRVENKLPIMAYKGQNFMPTAYGYKSYFGTTSRLDADALPGKADYVFVFQNDSLQNILLALCDNGIWYKQGDTAGAWTQVYVKDEYQEGGQYYPWSYTVINDKLYCYRQNNTEYQVISSQVAAPGFTLTNVTPSFLNMAGQLGVFRAGNRLGFWDSADSISWSNLDDFEDFTPSLETLAGNAVFSQVIGRIVNIVGHGQGFMVYATQSAVYVREAPESLYQWEPTRILDKAGIAYRRQVASAVPDTEHYAYTNIGLYEIKNGVPKIIVPSVTDYFKLDPSPKYLRFIEGRHLFIQTLNADFAQGIPQFTDEVIPDTIITLPGANLNLAEAIANGATQGSAGFCPIFTGASNGSYSQPEDEDPSIVWRPLYTAYLSSVDEMGSTVEWDANPCSVTNVSTGEIVGMTPKQGASLPKANTNISDKREVSGADAWLDGNWTITRFVQVQSAIWENQQQNLAAYLSQLMGRSHMSSRVYESAVAVESDVTTLCDIGNYITGFSGPLFGMSQCKFWLTRFATSAVKLKVRVRTITTSVYVPEVVQQPVFLGYKMGASYSYQAPCLLYYPTPSEANAACCAAVNGAGCSPSNTPVPAQYSLNGWGVYTQYTLPNGYTINGDYDPNPAPGFARQNRVVNGISSPADVKAAHYQVTKTRTAVIVAEDLAIPPTPETAFLVLTGWKDYLSGTVIGAASCTAPSVTGDDDTVGDLPIVIGSDGTFCSEPFAPITIPGTPAVTVNWPEQVVTLPGSSFLLQDGSEEPIYPTFEGAHVYDTHLDKWGKYKGRHKQLLDYSPINTYGPSEQSYVKFGIMGGILAEGGYLHLFDEYPMDSSITYGKFGYYRQGSTTVEEFHVHMRIPCTGSLTAETSLEGKNLSTGLSKTENYSAETKWSLYGAYPGRWHNLRIDGLFDISYLEYRGISKGKR